MMKSVTKEKVFHVLKMILLAITVTLVLLSLLGTVAHASGLVDDTVNADNLYSKYPLSNYPYSMVFTVLQTLSGQSACILVMPQDMWCNRRISWTLSMTWQTVSEKVSRHLPE